MTKKGGARVGLDGRDNAGLEERDGTFLSNVNAESVLSFESVGEAEPEAVVLESG